MSEPTICNTINAYQLSLKKEEKELRRERRRNGERREGRRSCGSGDCGCGGDRREIRDDRKRDLGVGISARPTRRKYSEAGNKNRGPPLRQ
jgi:hypothetical protein